MIAEKHLENLLHVVESYSSDPSYDALTLLIKDARTKPKSLDDFHKEINEILNKTLPLPHRSIWSRLFRRGGSGANTIQLRHKSLCTELRARMLNEEAPPAKERKISTGSSSSNKVIAIEATPTPPDSRRSSSSSSSRSMISDHSPSTLYTQDEFRNELMLVHVANFDSAVPLLFRNATMELIEHYNRHYEEKDNLDPTTKQYHRLRLLALKEWTSTAGYKSLIQAIKTFQALVEKGDLSFRLDPANGDLDEDDAQQHLNRSPIDEDNKLSSLTWATMAEDKKHQLLSWIEVLSSRESLLIAENPAAMRFILGFLTFTQHPQEKDQQVYMKQIEYFKMYFLGTEKATVLGRNCVAGINIADKHEEPFEHNMKKLQQTLTKQNWDEFKEDLTAIKNNLLAIYNELADLLVLNSLVSIKEFNLLLSTPNEQNDKKYQECLFNAFKYRAEALKSVDRRKTNQSDEPLQTGTKNGLLFTPNELDLFTHSRNSKRSDRERPKSSNSLLNSRNNFSSNSSNLAGLAGELSSSNSINKLT
ncbi:MAG: hypothetical protein ACHQAX_08525 [Gammaproteobacteria bacterium]